MVKTDNESRSRHIIVPVVIISSWCCVLCNLTTMELRTDELGRQIVYMCNWSSYNKRSLIFSTFSESFI